MSKITKQRRRSLFAGIMVSIALMLWGCGRTASVYLPDEEADVGCDTEITAGNTEDIALSAGDPAQAVDGKVRIGEEEEICVYVCGAVGTPGVYMLPQGSRIADAVDAAGGVSKNACTDYWNLAEQLSDGQMIDVPTKKEAADMRAAGSGADTQGSRETESGQEPGVAPDGKININTASKEQLMQIPGVGDTRAESIISYRELSGGFSGIEDIMKVNGIKEGLFAKMKDYISTSS